MYYGFFGLSRPPFKITPDTDMFFEGGNRGAILEALIYAISQGEGIIKVTGEVGSGKTMLCRMLQTRLPENIETIYLANPSVSPQEILHAIAFELQLPVTKDASRIEVMHKLNEFLLDRHAQRKQVVLFVEESQSMPLATLEEVRLLSNLETSHHKLLQIVLFGQPELDDNLRLPEIRQLRERITHSFSLLPFTVADVRPYLIFRLRAAGYRGPDLFNGRVVDYISRISAGLTRRVNIITDKALLAAFADGTHNVSLKHVKAAVRDSEFAVSARIRNRSPLIYILLGALMGGAIGLGTLTALRQMRHPDVIGITQVSDARSDIAPKPITGPRHASPSTSDPPVQRMEASTPLERQAITPNTPSGSEHAPATATQTPAKPYSQPLSETASPQPPDLLAQRLSETERWLVETDDSRFTIQILGASDAEILRKDLNAFREHIDMKRVFVYRTVANQRPSFTVLLGTYGTRAEAFREIKELPEPIRLNRPYYRTVRGVRAEIARAGIGSPTAEASTVDRQGY
jgi:type II secretory pathway predicted ATPase ExeA